MFRITSITPASRRDTRLEVTLDDGTALVVGLDAVERFRLAVGRALGEPERAALVEEGAIVHAVDRGLDLLAFRDRSAAELRRRLVRKEIAAPHAEAAVARLVAQGLVDDRRYAESVARSKVSGGSSRRRVEQELSRRGVARDTAASAVEEVWEAEDIDQAGAAVQLARRRAASLGGLDPLARRRRLYGFLARRGYEADEIRAALAAVLQGDAGDPDADGGEAHDDEEA